MSQTGLIEVIKLGGSCFKDISAMKAAASFVAAMRSPVVVVSAMAGVTDQLAKLSESSSQYVIEQAAVLASGEQVSAALFSMFLAECGRSAKSYQAWQLSLECVGEPLMAYPKSINKKILESSVNDGVIPVVCGFQGVQGHDVCVLGRGGSDITAIFIASELGLTDCYFYKDVDGVYVADPNILEQKIVKPTLSYAEMCEASSRGARVMEARAVDLARQHKIKLHIKGIHSKSEGTVVQERKSDDAVNIVAHVVDQYLVTIKSNKVEDVSDWLKDYESKGIAPRLISFDFKDGLYHWLIAIQSKVDPHKHNLKVDTFYVKSNLVAVSVVGWTVRHSTRQVLSILSRMSSLEVECHAFSLSDMSVTFWVDAKNAQLIIQELSSKPVSSNILESV